MKRRQVMNTVMSFLPYIAGFAKRLQKELKQVKVGLASETGKMLLALLCICKLKPPRKAYGQKDAFHIMCKVDIKW